MSPLDAGDDPPLAAELRAELAARAWPWPDAPLGAYSELPSTNTTLRAWAQAGAPEGSLVLARRQTLGRGRQGRAWHSGPGDVCVSWLLRPSRELRPGLLPLACGVAVVEALATWGLAARLKWPNDVLVGERKLAGLLAEAAAGGQGVDFVVVGLGLNLRTDFGVDSELADRATSVCAEGCEPPALASAVGDLLVQAALWYHALARDPNAVLAAWRAHALPWWGERVEVRTAEGVWCGTLRAVDADGALLVDGPDGAPLTLYAGDVSRLRRAGECA